jgi:NAD+ synthase/NAD+ synthase (glutamine-hydrolysing)
VRLALGQIDTTIGDFDGNLEKIERVWQQAEDAGADLLAVPELALCGYPPKDLLDRPAFQRSASLALKRLQARARGTALVVGTFLPNPGPTGKPFLNAAVLLRKGRPPVAASKTLLPTYDVFDEGRYFEPAPAPTLVRFGGERIGLTICEDLWNDKDFWRVRRLYQADPGEELLRRGATLLVNVSASPFSEGKPRLRQRMLSRLARDGAVPVAYVNLVGGNDELVFDGGSLVVDRMGRSCAAAPLFEESLLLVDVVRDAGGKSAVVPVARTKPDRRWDDPVAALHGALVLGIRDYARKCGFKTAVLGLSGGIDSALVAALAAEALGPENVTGIALPSRFSSRGSITDARQLAGNLGIRFETVPIEPLFSAAQSSLASLFRGLPEDVAEENVQSRIRGLILMAVSNKFGPLVLTTGNKSELAVGYCTLYGDMCGGLAPISDLPKMRVYALARHLNASAARPLIPVASLEKPPSAELRPGQTDQDSLPPYPLLDRILESLVERNLSVAATARRAGASRKLVEEISRKIDRAEYKRAQAAPGLKVSRKAFGSGRRLPIAQRSPQ